MSKYILKLDYYWADEFSVESLQIATKEQVEEFKNKLYKFEDKDLEGIEIYFGTNEFVTFSDVDSILDSLTIEEVSDEFADKLESILGNTSFGLINILYLADCYIEYYKDEE